MTLAGEERSVLDSVFHTRFVGHSRSFTKDLRAGVFGDGYALQIVRYEDLYGYEDLVTRIICDADCKRVPPTSPAAFPRRA